MSFLGEGMDLEVNEVGPINKKWRQIAIGSFAIVILAIVFWFAISMSAPKNLTIRFTDDKIRVGTSTSLIIEFRNTGSGDLKNVYFDIKPETSSIVLSSTNHTEPVIGAGAYRKLEIPLTVVGNLTEGTYRITVTADAGDKEYKESAYLEVVK